MAMLDGIKNKIKPGEPLDKDIYDLEPEELAKVPKTPGSLDEALDNLEKDHEFLLQGDVFTEDVISTWIWYKREKEVDAIRLRPHPYEFYLYYDILCLRLACGFALAGPCQREAANGSFSHSPDRLNTHCTPARKGRHENYVHIAECVGALAIRGEDVYGRRRARSRAAADAECRAGPVCHPCTGCHLDVPVCIPVCCQAAPCVRFDAR